MQEPLVSVHMITYNHAPYIAQAIECVLAQKTNFPFELVIGEDCSTDGTREIVFDFAKRFPDIIRVITSDKNVGMKANSYRTTQACQGKYIAYCEGDDYWHKNDKLQKQVDILEANPECSLICSDYDVLNVTTGQHIKNLVKLRGWKVPSSRKMEDYLTPHGGNEGDCVGGSIRTLTVMSHRLLIQQITKDDPYLYQDDFFKLGDVQLWGELNLRGKIIFIPESLATHRVLPESASNSLNKSKRLRFLINISDLNIYLCDKYNISLKIRKKHEYQRLELLLWLAFHEQDEMMAQTVKEQKGLTNIKEWLQYLGSKNHIIHFCYTLAARGINFLKIKDKNWI